MKKNTLTIATRESPLALWQARWVKSRLEAIYPTLTVHLLGLTTTADKLLETPLLKVGGKGLFVKELEDALLKGDADVAVHSMKDVPMELPEGLALPVMCEREDPRDAFVSIQYDYLDELPQQAILGTSSLRRQSQIAHLRPDLTMKFLRGNVNSRIEKLARGDYTAIILAAEGLKRLGLEHRIKSYLSIEQSLPAAGQGVLGIECRIDDVEIQKLIAPLNDMTSFQCVSAERAMCRYLGGGCHVPIAAYAEKQNDQIWLRGLVAKPDGSVMISAERQGPFDQAEALGIEVAKQLLAEGAGLVLAEFKSC